MPTVCELKIEAKKKGLKGYSNLNKAQLQALLNRHATPHQAAPRQRTVQQQRANDMAYAERVGRRYHGAFYGTGRNPFD